MPGPVSSDYGASTQQEPPGRIPLERLEGFGHESRSIIGWWTPLNGGQVHMLAIEEPVIGLTRDDLIHEIAKRPTLGRVLGLFAHRLGGLVITFTFARTRWPGYDELDEIRDSVASRLGWLYDELDDVGASG